MSLNRRCLYTFSVVFCALGFATSSGWAQMTPSIPSLSGDQLDRLSTGEILIDTVEGAAPIGDVMGIVDHTPREVMELIRDFDKYHEFMSDISVSEVVSQEGNEYLCHGITDTPWPMDDREWVIQATGGPTQVEGVDVILSTFFYVPDSGNLVHTEGFWLAIPWGEDGSKTLLRYRIQVDLGTWLPEFLINWSTENFLPNKIHDIRARLAAGGQ